MDSTLTFTETIVPAYSRDEKADLAGKGTARGRVPFKQKEYPFGAQGQVSTRDSGSARNVGGTRGNLSATLHSEVDPRTQLTLWSCPGLTVIGVESTEQFEHAVSLLTSRPRLPRDKGAIILPRNARFRINTAVRSLAHDGILVRTYGDEAGDVRSAARKFAQDFLVRQGRALENIEEFMRGEKSAD